MGAEKRALQEETKRELQAALIKANTVASGFNAKITKWKEMAALSESTGAQLKTKMDKVKQDILNADNASRDHKLAMATQKAQAATKVKAADDENAKRHKLKREKKAAFAAKAEAERQLEVINANNAKMQKRVSDLLSFLGKTTSEKHWRSPTGSSTSGSSPMRRSRPKRARSPCSPRRRSTWRRRIRCERRTQRKCSRRPSRKRRRQRARRCQRRKLDGTPGLAACAGRGVVSK